MAMQIIILHLNCLSILLIIHKIENGVHDFFFNKWLWLIYNHIILSSSYQKQDCFILPSTTPYSTFRY